MSDEIKEILYHMKTTIDDDNYFEINEESAKLLYNYITNLQQENDRLNNIINELEKILEFEKNDYGRNLDIETHNIDSEFLRGNSWEADYILEKLKELKENKHEKRKF